MAVSKRAALGQSLFGEERSFIARTVRSRFNECAEAIENGLARYSIAVGSNRIRAVVFTTKGAHCGTQRHIVGKRSKQDLALFCRAIRQLLLR